MSPDAKNIEKNQSGSKVAIVIFGFILGTIALVMVFKWLMGL